MSNTKNNFVFSPNFNFGTTNMVNENVFTHIEGDEGAPFPPVSGNMNLLDNTPMLLLDGTDMLLI